MKRQVGQLNLQIKQNEELKAEVAEGLTGMEAREQQVATLEGAVQSLKQIIKQNTGRISGLQQEVEAGKTEARKKDREIQAIRGQLSQSRQSIEDLQTILGDAGKTIDVKNGQIEALQRRVETFKQDKKNLLGIVQQLATIGNPAFNFKSFMDHFDEKEEEEDVNTFSASEEVRAFKTAPLFTQESQRSSRTNVAKDRSGGRRNKKQQSRKQLQSIPRGNRPEEGSFSQHQRRSFPASTINSIKAEVEKKAAAAAAAEKQKKKKLEEVLEVDEYDYQYDAAVPAPAATKHFDVEKAEKKKNPAEAINIFVNIEEKETSTPFTSFQQALGDFPSFVNMADKLNEVLPEILTPETTSTSTTTTTTTSTTTTASTTPPTTTTKVFFTTTTTAPETTTLTIPPIEETVGIDWNPLENAGDSDHAPIFVGMETVEIAPNFTVERVETSESKRSQSLNKVFQQSTPSSSQSQPKPFKSSQSEEVSQSVKSKAFKPSQAEPKQSKLSRVFKPSRRKHGRKVPNARKRFGQKVASSRY